LKPFHTKLHRAIESLAALAKKYGLNATFTCAISNSFPFG
jgi:hypothetical protein